MDEEAQEEIEEESSDVSVIETVDVEKDKYDSGSVSGYRCPVAEDGCLSQCFTGGFRISGRGNSFIVCRCPRIVKWNV